MSQKYGDDDIQVREARKEDMAAVADMIQELADYEKMPNGPKISVEELVRDGFERRPPAFRCLVAEASGCAPGASAPGTLLGYALFFPTYSTWQGRAILLEDLYVRPAARRRGVGQRLFNAVAKEAASCGDGARLDFHVLEWNSARQFYERAGAQNLTHSERWCLYRLEGEPLKRAGGTLP